MQKSRPDIEHFKITVTYTNGTAHVSVHTRGIMRTYSNEKKYALECREPLPLFITTANDTGDNLEIDIKTMWRWFRQHGLKNDTEYICTDHEDCLVSIFKRITNLQITFPFGTIKEQRTRAFLLGLHDRVGLESSIGKHFNGVFGETAVLGLIMEYL